MNIHFVCTGNTFRSRMAEAYLNSKNIPNIKASSSGIRAINNLDGDITSYTKKLLSDLGILKYTNKKWTQTTKEKLLNADLVVLMKEEHLSWVKDHLDFTPKNYLVFNVDDITDSIKGDKFKRNEFIKLTFQTISSKIDNLTSIAGSDPAR
ncbi:MAG: hypothetical protein Q8Q30_02485 [Candidatus Woesebacteria bacterium]|nr:hypothetical protein [Candidatus Woesebacteria bacterium]